MKSFTRREHLINHTRQHTGAYFNCNDICQVLLKYLMKISMKTYSFFSNINYLLTNYFVVFYILGETPFKCEFCPKAFARKGMHFGIILLQSNKSMLILLKQIILTTTVTNIRANHFINAATVAKASREKSISRIIKLNTLEYHRIK